MAGKPNLRSPWFPRLAIGFVGLLVLGAIVSIAIGEGGPVAREIGEINPVQQRFGGLEHEGIRIGPPDADVTVTLFNDPRCPSCGEYQVNEIGELIDAHVRTGQWAMELRPYSMVKEAITYPAIAVTAAALQDRGWQYADLLARNIEAAGAEADKEFLRLIAEATPNLDLPAWDEAFESDEVRDLLQKNDELGFSLELPPSGPSVVVDGPNGMRVLNESPSPGAIRAAVEEVSGVSQAP